MDVLRHLDDRLLLDVDVNAVARPLGGCTPRCSPTPPTAWCWSPGCWSPGCSLPGPNRRGCWPYATPGLLVLAHRTSDFSCPSDHAVTAGATAGLPLVPRRLGLLTATAALLMAAARVYIGAHYPWDVAARLALGAARHQPDALVALAVSAQGRGVRAPPAA